MTESRAEHVGARAKQVRLEKGFQQQEIADLLGLSLRGWQKIERNEGTPSGETLLLFEKIDINPGWVLTGLGPKSLSPRALPPRTEMLIELVSDVGTLINRLYKEVGVKISDDQRVSLLTRWYANLMGRIGPDDDWEAMRYQLSWVEEGIRAELSNKVERPLSSKRSAS